MTNTHSKVRMAKSLKASKKVLIATMLTLTASPVWAADLTTLGGRIIQILTLLVGLCLLGAFAFGVMKMVGFFAGLKKLKGAQQQEPTAAKDLGIDFAMALGLMGVSVIISYAVVSIFGTTAIIDAVVGSSGQEAIFNLNVGQEG